ncbi:MAG: hypothetical protein DRI48_06205 [Chloroflexi bacterium]|nr:MAG: hypothetical protein DRI48_06205 [Chloroflexota bacterium]
MKNERLFIPFIVGLGLTLGIMLLLGVFSGPVRAEAEAGDNPSAALLQTCVVSLTELHIDGPTSGVVGAAYAFTATVGPPSATLPITYDWRPAPTGLSGTVLLPTTHVATYTWQAVGPQTITLTVSNACNALSRTHTITLQPARIFLPLVMRNWPPMTWHSECVDCPPSIHSISQGGIALDSAGHPHVVYGGVKLYHAWHDGAGWRVEVVDPGFQMGAWAAIALDGDDYPHISYYNYDTGDLKYAHWDGSDWISETVDVEGGWDSYIAVDSQGHPHIVYRDAKGLSGTAIKYAHWDGAAWQIDTIEDLASTISSRNTTLALDNDDLPHISYSISASGDDPDHLYHAYQQVSGGDWLTETVETAYSISGNALALNSAGDPRILYHAIYAVGGEEYAWRLNYARWDGGQWQNETLYNSDNSIEALSLALDDSDVPHVGYYLSATDSMHYARRDGTWQAETVESDLLLDRDVSSLALDDTGQPHIIYLLENKTLKYAHREDATWQTEAIAEGGEPGRYNSIVLDRAEHPHVVYTDQDRMQLRYAAWDGAAWQIRAVDQGGWDYAFNYAGLALDGAGRPHVAYSKDDTVWGDTLHYAAWNGATWQTQALLTREFNSASNAVALVLDSAGRPHIVHGLWDGIAHTYWDGADWQSETVDAQTTSSPSRLSLTIDDGDQLHLAYWDMTNELLKYAQRDGAGWHVQTVDIEGRSPWIALDSAGRPHISYCRIPGSYCEELRYARWDGTQWLTSTLESGSRTGFHTSLALDSADRPRISYYNFDEQAVKYARWDGAAWQIETVGSGSYTALALDSADRPHISYYTSDGLRYAWWGWTETRGEE